MGYREPDYPDYDDTVCVHCGKTLPETIEPGTPQDEGYCDEECRTGTRKVIVSLAALAEHVGTDAAGPLDAVVASIRHRLYKDTECGIGFSGDLENVSVAGYCEGSAADCAAHTFAFPFRAEDFDAAVKEADAEGCALWNETHGCPSCFGGEGYDDGDDNPVDPDCPECHGAGVVL